MSDYNKATNFTAKDSLTTGDPSKIVLGAEIDTEFTAIETAIATKADIASPTFTGTVTVPNPSDGSDTTVAASTAFVRNILPAGVIVPYGGSSAPDNWLLCNGQAVSRATYATLFAVISTTYGTGDGSTTFNVPDLVGRIPLGAGTGTFAETVAEASWTDSGGSLAAAVTSNTFAWTTGMKVQMTTTNTLPTGLSLATDYYVIRVSATSLKFATSLANAVAGTAIAWTNDGTGDHTITYTLTAQTLGRKIGEETHANSKSEIPTGLYSLSDPGHTHQEQVIDDSGGSINGARQLHDAGGSGGYSIQGSNIPAKTDSGALTTASSTTGASLTDNGGSAAHNNMQPSLVINYIIKT